MNTNKDNFDPFEGISADMVPPPGNSRNEEDPDLSALTTFLDSTNPSSGVLEVPASHTEIILTNANDIDAKGSITHPFVKYFSDKLIEHEKSNSKDNRYNGFINKSTKSGWFTDFNSEIRANKPTQSVFCKPNSLFFIESDSMEDALKQSGLAEDRVKALKDKFDFVFIGNTSTRSRTPNEDPNAKGLKTYVLALKDPDAQDAEAIYNEFKQSRDIHIQKELNNNKTLDDAVSEVIAKKEKITETLKGHRFFGTDDHLFLNVSATRAFLDSVPGLKGQYAVYPVKHEDNKVQYLGEAPKMESYFTDNIQLCEVKVLKESKLSQEELESKIKEALVNHPGHVAQTPQSAFTKQDVIPNAENISSAEKEKAVALNPDGTPNKEGFKVKSQYDNSEEEEYKKRKARQQEDDKEQEKKSIATSLAEAAAKMTAAALETLVALAKMLLALVMALLQLVLKGVNMAARRFDPGIPVRESPKLIDVLDNMQFRKRNGMTYDHNPDPNANLENSKQLAGAISENAQTLEIRPDTTAENDSELKTDIEKELKNLNSDFSIDKAALAAQKAENFSPKELEKFSNEAADRLATLSDEKELEILNNLNIKTTHAIASDLDVKLAPKSFYHPEYGVLLAKNDKVLLENGTEAGVLAAFSVAGKLHYATAHEADGQYSINYTPADKLTLLGHNAVHFDNESNLIDQTVKSIMDRHGADGKVHQIEILNHLAPAENSLTVRQIAAMSPLVGMDKLGLDISNEDVQQLVYRNMDYHTALYKSIPQLHTDKSGEPNNTSSGLTHPMFGRMLDINDHVESILPNGRIKVDGAVIGSYAYNDDLYYQIKSEDQIYNLKAQDLTLLKYNGGDLTEEEIAKRAIDKLYMSNGKPLDANIEAKLAGVVDIPLRHIHGTPINVDLPLGVHQVQHDQTNAKIIEPGTSNVGITPLNYIDGVAEGSGKIFSMNKSHFVSLGETTDPVNGMKRAVCAEIKKVGNTFTGQPLEKSRMVQLNLDDPNVILAKNGLSGSDVLDSVKMLAAKALAIYETGSLKRQAVVMNKFGNEIKSEILANSSIVSELAKESIIQNEVAAKILEAKADTVSLSQTHEIGFDANLANSSIDLHVVEQQIVEPDAVLIMEQPPLVADSGTLTPNEIIDVTATYDASENFHTLSEQLLVEDQQLVYKGDPDPFFEASQIKDWNSDVNDFTPDRSIEDVVSVEAYPLEHASDPSKQEIYSRMSDLTLINAASDVNDGPHAASVKFVATYLTGAQLSSNEDGVFDLLSEKAELEEMRNMIQEKASSIAHEIQHAFSTVQFKNGIPDFTESVLADSNQLKAILDNNIQLSGRIQDLAVSASNYQDMFNEHLDHVAETVISINERFSSPSLNENEQSHVNIVREAFAFESLSKLQDLSNVTNFAHVLTEMNSSKDSIDYGVIVGSLTDSACNSNANAIDRVNSIADTFIKHQETGSDKKLSNENGMSL